MRIGLKQTQPDPYEWFNDKKVNDTLTVKILNTDNRGLTVQPEGSKIELQIKKSQIAINAADARPSRFITGDRIDAAIQEIDIKREKSIFKYQTVRGIAEQKSFEMGSDPLSGRQLPFSSLSNKLIKKKKKRRLR